MPAKIIEMIVSLKVPDTTAITALQTLQKIGFSKIKDVKRADYYKFFIEGNEEKFKNQICRVDILVNANKHSYSFSMPRGNVSILVKNINDAGTGLLSTLKKRLGLTNIKKIEKGTLWILDINADYNELNKIAEKAARELFVNENYQKYRIL